MKTTRRGFLKGAAGSTALFSIVPRYVLGGAGFVPPSEKVNIAVIGVGGMGMRNVQSLLNEPEARIAAICDVAEETDLSTYWYKCHAGRRPVKALVEEAYAKTTPNYRCADYEDFRLMLEKEKGVDAVLCATPDHTHAFIAITAMRQGKHVYCEKPLAHNIWETRLIAKVARETGVATQMGNHGHSSSGMRTACEWIWDGAIGAVREIHAWSPSRHWRKEPGRPLETPPVPAGFNWDLWLGPREFRPYHPAYAPYIWRDWWAFGTGSLGNLAVHNLDTAVWALNLEHPLSVEGVTTGGVDSEVAAYGGFYTYQFGPRGDRPAVKMTWYDGGLRPPVPEGIDADDPRQRLGDTTEGLLLVGDKGFLTCPPYGGAPRLLPLALHKAYKRPAPTLPRVKGHHSDWLSACKGGPAASANFEYGARLTELVLLGNVALRVGKKIRWDAAAMKATNAPEADAFIREACRKGWELA
jgi:predicted dehydrogenase